jgi:hypothetical protein
MCWGVVFPPHAGWHLFFSLPDGSFDKPPAEDILLACLRVACEPILAMPSQQRCLHDQQVGICPPWQGQSRKVCRYSCRRKPRQSEGRRPGLLDSNAARVPDFTAIQEGGDHPRFYHLSLCLEAVLPGHPFEQAEPA